MADLRVRFDTVRVGMDLVDTVGQYCGVVEVGTNRVLTRRYDGNGVWTQCAEWTQQQFDRRGFELNPRSREAELREALEVCVNASERLRSTARTLGRWSTDQVRHEFVVVRRQLDTLVRLLERAQ